MSDTKSHTTLKKYFNAVEKGQPSAKKIISKFNEQSGSAKITTLHLAVMTWQYETAKKLLTIMRVDANSTDWRGWTPLHHAVVLKNARMINLLIKFGARGNLQNDQEGTPVDLYEMIHADKIPLKDRIYQITDDDNFAEMTREEFEEVSGAKYIDRMLVKPELFLEIWARKSPKNPEVDMTKDCRKQYYDLTRDVQTLALQIEGRDETGKRVPIGSSTVAMRDIKKGEVVCEYLGSYCPSDEIGEDENDEYRLSRVDGEHVRNPGPIVPDGCPNAMGISLTNIKGLPERNFLIATTNISKGTSVAWDYATNPIKYARIGKTDAEKSSLSNRYIEVFPHTLNEFLQKNNFHQILMNLYQFTLKSKFMYEYEDLSDIAVISYVLNTPVAFIKHVLNGNLSEKDLAPLFDKEFLNRTHLNQGLGFYNRPVLFQIEASRAIMKTPEKYTFLRDFLLAFLDKGYLCLSASLMTTLTEFGIHNFEDVKGFSPEDFNHFKELVYEFLDKEKGRLAFEVLLTLFRASDPKILTNLKNLSKDGLRSYYLGKESKILSNQDVVRETDSKLTKMRL